MALRVEDVAKRPPWVTYLIVAFYSMLGAGVMAGALYFKLPDYNALAKNQVAIYKAIEELRGVKSKAQSGK